MPLSAPAYRSTSPEDGKYAAGVAIPIAQARLKAGASDQTIKVAAADKEAVFKVKLPAGRTTFETWFLDEGGKALLSAYYAYVKRV